MSTRWSLRLFGLKVAFSGTDLRGPVLNVQTMPSVRPLKWQLAQLCQPSLDSRSWLDVVWPAGLLNRPRDEKNISAPTSATSSGEPGAGSGAVRITLVTASVVRSTTDTLRDTKFWTYARVPCLLTTMPCGFLPALLPAVAGFAGSFRSM